MKNTVSKLLSVKLALVSLILAGLFLLAPSQAQAQTTTNDLFSVPTSGYTSSATAIERVDAKLVQLKENYSGLNAPSQAYTENGIKIDFYSIILAQLKDGKTVKESLEAGLKFFGTDAASDLSRPNMLALKQEATNLLKQ